MLEAAAIILASMVIDAEYTPRIRRQDLEETEETENIYRSLNDGTFYAVGRCDPKLKPRYRLVTTTEQRMIREAVRYVKLLEEELRTQGLYV